MPLKSDQYVPSLEAIELLKTALLDPKLAELGQELGIFLSPKYLVDSGSEIVALEGPSPANGECRIYFWRTYQPERSIFRIAARFPELSNPSGFSGFNFKGSVKSGSIKNEGFTVCYNDNTWPKW